MKLTMENYVNDFRKAIGDNSYHINNIIDYLNKAQTQCTFDLEYLIKRKKSYATVAYQSEYSLPSDYAEMVAIRWDKDPMGSMTWAKLEELSEQDRNSLGDATLFWHRDTKFGFWYRPDAASPTSEVYTAVSSTTTTSIVIDYDAEFPDRGVIQIDSEVIYYDKKTDSSTTYSTLSVCTRGAEGTIAATHAENATVTLLDIEIFYYAYPKKFIEYPEGGTLTVSAGGSIDAGDHDYLVTFYSYSLGAESYPYRIGKATATGANGTVSFSNLPVSTDTDVTYKRIYRTKADSNIYYYLTEIANATTTGTDTAADSTLSTAHSYPYSELPQGYHKAITDKALAYYFEDLEETERAILRHTMADRIIIEGRFREQRKLGTKYRTKPMPQ